MTIELSDLSRCFPSCRAVDIKMVEVKLEQPLTGAFEYHVEKWRGDIAEVNRGLKDGSPTALRRH